MSALTVLGGRPHSVMVVIVEGGLASVPCNKLDGDRLSGKDSGMRRGVVHGCGMGVGARAAQLSRFVLITALNRSIICRLSGMV